MPSEAEGEGLENVTDPCIAGTVQSSADNQQAQKVGSVGSAETRASSHVSIISASRLCEMPDEWDIWASKHKIRFVSEDWKNETFDDFMASLKYPRYIQSEGLLHRVERLVSRDPKGAEAIRKFKTWRNGLSDTRLEDCDTYGFEEGLFFLVACWRSISFQASTAGGEASIRKAIHDLIELAFQLRPGADQAWRSEVEMALPDSPETVRAGTVVTWNFRDDWDTVVKRFNNNYVFSWASSPDLIYIQRSIITFLFEAKLHKPQVARRRIQLTMYSSQLHRRALCLRDGPVFGASLDHNVLTFYVSYWKGDTVIVQSIIGKYEVLDFADFVEIYFILCRISEFQSSWLQEEMARWNEDPEGQKAKLKESRTRRWRREYREFGNRNHAEGGNREGQGGGDHYEPVPDKANQEVDIGTSRAHDINLLEDRIKRGDSPPKDGYPLSEVYLYIFDHNAKFQPHYRISSVSEWATEPRQFDGCCEDADLGLLEYTTDKEVVFSVDTVSSDDTNGGMESTIW
ncbi:uncharacterized protein FOMMEDRAFT_171140 [Fomitiporia mediterranea MF3/22]|uniref:uncharacterized protein n=1 Tax=Fomitiporia mediterranea (strain MF3/22) TaxID=694068 RepID=UPI0004407F3A|nr:uncharacterized protein FOMMEDRAFT_171140 [Fomitiporia mediterranea MF3/22]EJC98184.1 hypothetical protein FOMMEDRAFT_171140 [Fomitiporia mediterranea MF3/22]